VGGYGRVFDLIVLSRPNTKSTGLHNRAPCSCMKDSNMARAFFPSSMFSSLYGCGLTVLNSQGHTA
jgi:hypothetical protein